MSEEAFGDVYTLAFLKKKLCEKPSGRHMVAACSAQAGVSGLFPGISMSRKITCKHDGSEISRGGRAHS